MKPVKVKHDLFHLWLWEDEDLEETYDLIVDLYENSIMMVALRAINRENKNEDE